MNFLTLKVKKAIVTWGFAFEHDLNRTVKMLLPDLHLEYTRLEDHTQSDFYVGVALEPWNVPDFIAMASFRPVYLLAGEPGQRYDTDEAIQFVNTPAVQETLPDLVRYAPVLLQWAPQIKEEKRRPVSVIDSGRHKWRSTVIEQLELRSKVPFDKYGKIYRRPLQGYHQTGVDSRYTNDKYLGLKQHAFNLAIENTSAEDYLTEKFYDPINCLCAPIYYGCQNLDTWVVQNCYVPIMEYERVLHATWMQEYVKMLPNILQQKQLIKEVYNYISYFLRIIEDQNELQNKRCFTIQSLRVGL